jgi:hypothetical protein
MEPPNKSRCVSKPDMSFALNIASWLIGVIWLGWQRSI